MHETTDDLALLQDLLDRSYAAAGPHLLSIITAHDTRQRQKLIKKFENHSRLRAWPAMRVPVQEEQLCSLAGQVDLRAGHEARTDEAGDGLQDRAGEAGFAAPGGWPIIRWMPKSPGRTS